MLFRAVVPRIGLLIPQIRRKTCLRLESTSELKTLFPLQLPRHFQFNSSSVTYHPAHQLPLEPNGRSIAVENPATGDVIHSITSASEKTIDDGINHAHELFIAGTWSRLPLTTRYQTLLNVANLLRDSRHSLAARSPLILLI